MTVDAELASMKLVPLAQAADTLNVAGPREVKKLMGRMGYPVVKISPKKQAIMFRHLCELIARSAHAVEVAA